MLFTGNPGSIKRILDDGDIYFVCVLIRESFRFFSLIKGDISCWLGFCLIESIRSGSDTNDDNQVN